MPYYKVSKSTLFETIRYYFFLCINQIAPILTRVIQKIMVIVKYIMLTNPPNKTEIRFPLSLLLYHPPLFSII